ncbi:hypothetical protein GCM10011352_37250 [Marinobacterium zhoushanense]|uniref:Methyltransferase family protein n=1 Tax=Marinobacterium zhoushanense TaxID=1679163 RepID=A0ABQ1KRE3_9GAMM|nr:class I SAM-dependent methyltransferase [Marinobacterium zhoushanense]GGC07540.1 hypothetical protein GCM10011352_37250 [Marinobacterium zhoushanense]
MKKLNKISIENMSDWFTSKTDPDYQLKDYLSSKGKGKKFYPTYQQISRDLFRCDSMYENLSEDYGTTDNVLGDPNLAHIDEKDFTDIVNMVSNQKLKIFVEVGSFCGSSALFFSNYFQQHNINAIIICIDTWCGDINMWLRPEFDIYMNKSDGNPDLFKHFINSVIKFGKEESIIPLRSSSVVAARMLEVLAYKIDAVYLDSAHESGETFMELNLYFDLLRDGGVIFGDDYNIFPAVKKDVDLFSEVINQKVTFFNNKNSKNPIWMFKK